MANGFDKFPSVNFDWLGELPGLAEEGRLRGARQSLGDLDLQTPKGLREAATKLMRTGGLKEMEQGIRLLGAATAQDEAKRRAAADSLYNPALMLQILRGGKSEAPAAPPAVGGGYSPPGTGDSEPAPAMPSWLPGAQSAVQPPEPEQTAELPPSLARPPVQRAESLPSSPAEVAFSRLPGQPPQPPLGPRPISPGGTPPIRGPYPHEPYPGIGPGKPGERIGSVPETSEGILAAAEGGAPEAPAPRARLAQVGGGPVPGLARPGPVPWADPAAGNVLPEAQAGTPPVLAPTVRGPRPGLPGMDPKDQAELDRLGEALIVGGRRNTPGTDAIKSRYNSIIERQKWDPEIKRWQLDRSDRWERGLPDISYREWKLEPSLVQERHKEAISTNRKFAEKGEQGEKLGETMTSMRRILEHDKFISGDKTWFDDAQRGFANFVDRLRAEGFPESLLPNRETLRGYTEPGALKDAFTSLTNRAVVEYLGGLGPAISNTDRDYIGQAFPSLGKSKEGNDLVIQTFEALAARQKKVAKLSDEYMERHGSAATSWGMRDYLSRRVGAEAEARPILKNRDGTLTTLGRAIAFEAARIERIERESAGRARPLIPQSESSIGAP